MAPDNANQNGGDNRISANLLAQTEAAIVGNFEDERLSRTASRASAYPQDSRNRPIGLM
jgi:hypothetical protein